MARPTKAPDGFRKSFFFWDDTQYQLCAGLLKVLKDETVGQDDLDRMTIADIKDRLRQEEELEAKRAELKRQLAELDRMCRR